MKALSFILAIVFFSSSCVSQNFLSVSKRIEKTCVKNKVKWKGETFHNLRVKLYNDGKLAFLSNGFDTLYILESYEIESGVYTGMIWNAKDTLSYNYNKGSFNFPVQKPYTAYTIQLMEKWDTVTIRNEERINAMKLPEKYITGIRLIKQNGEIRIGCIKFKEFFSLEREH